MGKLLNKVRDDYDDYVNICDALRVQPGPINSCFYDQLDALLTQCGVSSVYEFWKKDIPALVESNELRLTIAA